MEPGLGRDEVQRASGGCSEGAKCTSARVLTAAQSHVFAHVLRDQQDMLLVCQSKEFFYYKSKQ